MSDPEPEPGAELHNGSGSSQKFRFRHLTASAPQHCVYPVNYTGLYRAQYSVKAHTTPPSPPSANTIVTKLKLLLNFDVVMFVLLTPQLAHHSCLYFRVIREAEQLQQEAALLRSFLQHISVYYFIYTVDQAVFLSCWDLPY